MVHFSGFARKINHIPLFCERSEFGLSNYIYLILLCKLLFR
ncbi:MAG: hypothetical protein U5L45_21485 [Saprospiraceae bacterium]|nr:hypothetical protein [Saprospiraceae bacterium]